MILGEIKSGASSYLFHSEVLCIQLDKYIYIRLLGHRTLLRSNRDYWSRLVDESAGSVPG